MAELIVALDMPDAPSAVALLDQLPAACAVKVGSVLMTQAGSGFIRALVDQGHPVFLDLKWHDIPNTVSGAVTAARQLGVDMVTVHALGGAAMIEAALAAAGGAVRVVAVTVLTSHDPRGWGEITGHPVGDVVPEVVRLTRMAIAAGADGVVCSAREVAAVRPLVPGRIVVPGIRRAGDGAGDQERTATPLAAVTAGATHLVVGRPILEAPDPGAAYAAFHSEMSR